MNKKTFIKLIIITIILIIINISIYIVKIVIPNSKNAEIIDQYNKEFSEKYTYIKEKEEKIAIAKSQEEGNRIVTYISDYIGYIERKDYESAYNLLYPKFRESYFKNQQGYSDYVQRRYPSMMAIDCKNIERLGKYYIVGVEIVDLFNPNENKINIKFVLIENDYCDYELSFQVI